MVGDLRQLSFVRPDRGNVFGLANEIQSAQSLPDLVSSWIQRRDFVSGSDRLPGLYWQFAQPATHRRSDFYILPARFKLGDDSALMNGRAQCARIGDLSGLRSGDLRRLQQRDNMRSASNVSEADQRQRRIALSGKQAVGQREAGTHDGDRPARGDVANHRRETVGGIAAGRAARDAVGEAARVRRSP